MNRRQFIGKVLLGSAALLLSGCRATISNENRPGFFIRYFRPYDASAGAESWVLTLEGMLREPVTLKFAQLTQLAEVQQASRLTCVEGWSAAAKWQGVRFRDLISLVQLEGPAQWVSIYCADGYYESLPLAELLKPRVLLAYGMNGAPLPPEHGGPLRLIVPHKYGYKSAKVVNRLVFAETQMIGSWTSQAPFMYGGSANIAPGGDYPLDLGGEIRTIPGGEVFYPDGLESQGD